MNGIPNTLQEVQDILPRSAVELHIIEERKSYNPALNGKYSKKAQTMEDFSWRCGEEIKTRTG